jgi:hypothetical protein
VPPDDRSAHLAVLVDEWGDSGLAPGGSLLAVIKVAIEAGMPTTEGSLLARRYEQLLRSLAEENLDLGHALGLISQAPFGYHLAAVERMSATQVARVLTERLGGAFVSWQACQKLLSVLGLRPHLEWDPVETLLEKDRLAALGRFADTDPVSAAELVGVVATRLGFPGECAALLQVLVPSLDPDELQFPYLQAIEFQGVITRFFDHPPQFLYEFAPRGRVATNVFDRYPPALVPTANPILNNFKAIEAVDSAWARSRSVQAHALAGLLGGMASMPHPARRELAEWIRQWVRHVVGLLDSGFAAFPAGVASGNGMVSKVIDFVSAANTGTFGIAEQRLVDALSVLKHPDRDGWRSRGVGDAVNAPNLARAKVGDSDFQDTAGRRITGYEPHGGRLTTPYLAAHHRSLSRSIERRAEREMSAIADPVDWSVGVVFVAHQFSFDPTQPLKAVMHGVETVTTFTTFADLARDVTAIASSNDLQDSIEQHFFAALNRRQTPQAVRERVADALGITLVATSSP